MTAASKAASRKSEPSILNKHAISCLMAHSSNKLPSSCSVKHAWPHLRCDYLFGQMCLMYGAMVVVLYQSFEVWGD